MLRRQRRLARLVLLVATVTFASACADDETSDEETTSTTATATALTTAGTAAGNVEDACALVPVADVAAATGLDLDVGQSAGDERRRTCTFQDADAGLGVTVAVEAGGRFDDKADASRRSLGVDGEEVADLGDRALFFFSDEDIPEGVGGTLVGVGELTIDVTLQGMDEDTLRTASVDVARLAVDNL